MIRVRDLIAELQTMPPLASVFVEDDEGTPVEIEGEVVVIDKDGASAVCIK